MSVCAVAFGGMVTYFQSEICCGLYTNWKLVSVVSLSLHRNWMLVSVTVPARRSVGTAGITVLTLISRVCS